MNINKKGFPTSFPFLEITFPRFGSHISTLWERDFHALETRFPKHGNPAKTEPSVRHPAYCPYPVQVSYI